jgi:hypothetical protein
LEQIRPVEMLITKMLASKAWHQPGCEHRGPFQIMEAHDVQFCLPLEENPRSLQVNGAPSADPAIRVMNFANLAIGPEIEAMAPVTSVLTI